MSYFEYFAPYVRCMACYVSWTYSNISTSTQIHPKFVQTKYFKQTKKNIFEIIVILKIQIWIPEITRISKKYRYTGD